MNERVTNLNELIEALKPYLKDYLEKVGTIFSNNHFQCPGRSNHANDDEKPSASFNPHFPGDIIFKCFSCDAEGDVFKAAHLLEGKPIKGQEFISQNVLYLAKMFNLPYETQELSPEEKLRKESFRALTWVSEIANKSLWKSPALQYVRERRWSDDAINEFKIGYVVYTKLYDLLEKEGFEIDVLKNAGLTSEELFNSRLLFPVRDERGYVRGFAGRSLLSKTEQESKQVQKYYNSKVSLIYKKSELLFNLHNIKGNTVMVVEGYADVVTLWDRGMRNVVGLGGVELSEEHLKILSRLGIRNIILCLDSDKVGQEKEEKILEQIKRRHGLNVQVKVRDDCEDPDTCLQKHDFLLSSPTMPLFEHRLEQYKKSGNRIDRDKMLRSICIERSPLERSVLCRRVSKALDLREKDRDSLIDEIDYLLAKGGEQDLIDENKLTKEAQQNELDLEAFEKQAQQGHRVGLLTGFTILDEKMRGVKNLFWILAGREGMGKSAFQRCMMMGLIKNNPDRTYCLYFSLDDSKEQVISYLVASEAGCEINQASDPKNEIKENINLSAEEKSTLLERRNSGFQRVKNLATSFTIKDSSEISDMSDMESAIKVAKSIAGERQLVVFVDSLHRVKSPPTFRETTRERFMHISDELKRWRVVYDIPIISTAELRRPNSGENKQKRPTLEDIKEAGDFGYDAEVILLFYNEMRILEHDGLTTELKFGYPDKEMPPYFPVLEVTISRKNKSSGFNGALYYKFLDLSAKLYECNSFEQSMYWNRSFNNTKK